MNSMNPREPAIGYLLASSAFHTFAVSAEGLCDCRFTVQVRSYDIHILSKPFFHQRFVLPRPAVDSVKELEPQLCSLGRGAGRAVMHCSELCKFSVCRQATLRRACASIGGVSVQAPLFLVE